MSEAYHEHEKLSREYLGLLRGDEPVDPRVEDDLLERINDLWLRMDAVERAAIAADLDARYAPREYR